jgi:xanthine dehydrogenase accessory factor
VIELYQDILSLLDAGRCGAVATVVHSAGSSPQKVGSKMLVLDDGSIRGTIGGGAIEHATRREAAEVIATGQARVFKAHLTRDLAMCCGGRMEIFIEPVGDHPALIVFGGGHVGAALVDVAAVAGFRVHVVDGREGFAAPDRHPRATSVRPEPPLDCLDELPWGANAFAVIVTHDHRLDEDLLAACVARPSRYLGMIGSRAKVHRFLRRYESRGRSLDEFAEVRAPVGLAIRAREPGEIAVAIVAEMIAVRRGAAPGPFASLQVTNQAVPARSPGDLPTGAGGEGAAKGD